jgi:hypothetical protein
MVNTKLGIERWKSEDLEDPADGPQPLLQPVSHRSIRPYVYRIPKDSLPIPDRPPPSQRRSTDDQPIGPQTK